MLGSLLGGALLSIGGFYRALGLIQRRLHIRQVLISAKPSSALAIRSMRVLSTAIRVNPWIKGTVNVQ